jgi:hypothetical protein
MAKRAVTRTAMRFIYQGVDGARFPYHQRASVGR